MSKCKFHWNFDLLVNFVHYAVLDDEEYEIMKGVVQNKTTKEIADIVNLSTATVDRRIKVLREKYDALVIKYPDIFPKREKGSTTIL